MDKRNNLPWIIAVAVLVVIIAYMAFDFRLLDKGELPQVKADVDVEGGRMPRAEVRGPDVDVGTKTAEVEVPKVEVESEKVEVPVPTVDVDLPEDTKGNEPANQ